MENAPIIGLSRQVALRRQLDVVSNNLANINTSGFRAEKILFEDYLMPNAKNTSFLKSGQKMHYTQDWATMHDTSPGTFTQTGNDLDVALEGPGFIAVDTPQGVRYTRDGQLHLNEQGTLVNAEGFPIRSGGGTITFGPTETDIRIDEKGSVLSSAGNKGQIQIAEFESPQSLKREGNNLYSASENLLEVALPTTRVRQGMVEGSNVSGVREMSDMIRVNRSYEMVSQFIKRHDELRSSSIRKLGSLSG